jgi:membrane protein required for colicin V production
MIWIDIVIGLLLILDIVRGIKKGFASEAGTIVGIILGFLIASASGKTMATFLLPVCRNSEQWSNIFGFLLTFAAVLALVLIFAKLFEGILDAISLGWTNKLAGGAFSLLRGLLVWSIIINLYQAIDKDCSIIGKERAKASVFYKPIRNFAPAIFPTFRLFKHPEDPLNEDPKTMET